MSETKSIGDNEIFNEIILTCNGSEKFTELSINNAEEIFIQEKNDEDRIEEILSKSKSKNFIRKESKQIVSNCGNPSSLEISNLQPYYDCKEEHKNEDITFRSVLRNLDISNIDCENRKNCDQSKEKEENLYACSCGKTLCKSCLTKHLEEVEKSKTREKEREKELKNHSYFLYEEKFLYCYIHREKFVSFCKRCKKDLCPKCLEEHKFHDIENFSQICDKYIPDIKENMNKIKKFVEDGKKIQIFFDGAFKNLVALVDIGERMVKNYHEKNMTYKTAKTIQNIGNGINVKDEGFSNIFNCLNESRIVDKIPYYTRFVDSIYRNLTKKSISRKNTIKKVNSIIKEDEKKIENIKKYTKFGSIPPRSSLIEEEKIRLNNSLFKNNKMFLKYSTKDAKNNKVKIFSKIFYLKNRNKCKIKTYYSQYYNEYELSTEFDLERIPKLKDNILEIELEEEIGETITDFSYMFGSDIIEEKIPLLSIEEKSLWNTSKVTDMSGLFSYCQDLQNISIISSWNTKNVENISYMFYKCLLQNLPDISDWRTENVKDFSYMFGGCTELTSLPDISKWTTSSAKNFEGLFDNCKTISDIPDISTWDTFSVNNMKKMMNYCLSLKSIPDISKWNVGHVRNMEDMFSSCILLMSIPEEVKNWNSRQLTNTTNMFFGCSGMNSQPEIRKSLKLERTNVWVEGKNNK